MVCVFAREISEPLTSLVKNIDSKIADHHALKSFVVILTDDADKTSAKLKQLAEKHGISNVPLTLIEGAEGPSEYKIAKNADITVMMWRQTKVKVNHSFAKGELTAAKVKDVVADISKIMGD